MSAEQREELHSLRHLKEPGELMIPSENSLTTEYDQSNKRARSAGTNYCNNHQTNINRRAAFLGPAGRLDGENESGKEEQRPQPEATIV